VASEYVLSARLKVEGGRDFVDDLERAERAARDANDAFRKLKDIKVEVSLRGARDFEDDATRAALAVYDLDDALEKLKAQSSAISLDGAAKFVRQLDEVQLAIIKAKDYFDEFNRDPIHLDRITGIDQAVTDLKDLRTHADAAVKALRNLRELDLNLDIKGADDAIADISRVEEVAMRMVRTFNILESDPLNLGAVGVGELRADLEAADVAAQGLDRALRGINTAKLREAADETSKLHQVMSNLGRGLAYSAMDRVFDTIADGAADAAREVVALDEKLKNALSITAPGTNLGQLEGEMKALARSISKDLGTPVSEVANGFYDLISAGLTMDEVMAGIEPAARFAKGGLIDLEDAVHKGAQAFAIFKDAANEAGGTGYSMQQIFDALAQASNVSQGDIDTFADALTNKAGTAAYNFGQTLETTLGVLAAFHERGVEGKVAGEQYSIVLRDMRIKALQNEDAFKKLGIAVFDQKGQMRQLTDIIPDVQSAFAGLSDKQAQAELAALGFTLRSQNVILSMIGMGDRAVYFKEKMLEAGGAVDRMVEIQLTSLQSMLDRLRSYTIDIAISGVDALFQLGAFLKDTFAPAMEASGPAAAAFARGFGDAMSVIGQAVGGAVVAGLQGLAKAIEVIGGFASQHTDAVYALGSALAVFLSIQAASATISALGSIATAAGNLAPNAMEAAKQLGALGKALVMRDAAGASSALAGLAGAINPLTVGLIGLAAVAGYGFLQLRKEAEAAKERVDELTQAFADAGIAAQDMGTAILTMRGVGEVGDQFDRLKEKAEGAMAVLLTDELVGQGLAEPWAELGISIEEAAKAVGTGTDLFEMKGTTLTAKIHELKEAAAGAPGPVRDLAAALVEAHESGRVGWDEMRGLVEAIDEVADASDDALGGVAKFAEEQLALARVTGELTQKELENLGIKDLTKAKAGELVAAYDKWKGSAVLAAEAIDDARFKNLQRNMEDMREPLGGVADGMEEVALTAEEAAAQMTALSEATNALVQGPLNALTAGADFQQSMVDFAEATKEAGFSLDATTESGRNTIDAFAALVNSGLAWAEAQAQGDPAVYAAKLGEMHSALVDLLTPLVGSREEAELLLAQFNLFPAEIPVEVKVTSDLEDAQARMREYTEADYETNVQAKADLALAKSDLAGLTSEPRTARINTDADTAPADTKINEVATRPRVATVLTEAQVAGAEVALAALAVARTVVFSAVSDGSSANINAGFDYAARARDAVIAASDYGTGAQVNAGLDYAARARTAYIDVMVSTYNRIINEGGGSMYNWADGGVVEYYAGGGMRENHVAQFAPAGAWRVWAEPETGGEAYIPLHPGKRNRSLEVWKETGKRLGVQGFAEGGMVAQSAARVAAMNGGGGVSVVVSPGAIQANVSAAVNADPDALAAKIRDAMGPALDEFALNLTTAIRRRG